ncbi:rhs family protein (plasmid) [Candidatus Protochlamydia naegleriophila]|uniref:Rhs family protein n=1 Tax=Candidatus Protochlamydia naegleriophila TaxID=389348 RepID=A0A0U5JI21_9BACT|nr:RHS repeat-associated core domain-containing protein [Candidatus Protochlamydia naegleriophila]CUI18079.1 rhs family protein [Candidatus Protochlamydia naegleriophila]
MVDAKGQIQELRILGTGYGAELGAAVAIEIKGRAFAPTHDHQGHVVSLIDATTGQPSEAYRYTTFGEETLINAQGAIIQTSEVGNPWRFASKRVDPETGWVYFGRRFYDPSNGRWTTTDPLGFADGPNLYAYLHHSPLSAFDAYGFVGEAYRDGCNVATNPNYFDGISNEYSPVFGDNAGNDAWASVQWQETKENLYAAFAGCVHGCFDFLTSHAYLFQSLAFAAGCDDLECSLEEKIQIQQAFAISQSNQIAATDAFVQQTMGVDANNAIYQAFRSGTTTTLEVATIAMGGYGLAKGAVGVVKAARIGMLEAKMASQALKQEAKYIAKPGMSINRGAESVNAGINLNKKLSQLEQSQQTAARIRELPDDRIRYYGIEKKATNSGPTRGACYVVEYTPHNGQTRGWYECYDHTGNVNRVHPKSINGQTVTSPHYPLIASEL